MFCQKCGVENKDGAAFCNSCGAVLSATPPTAPVAQVVCQFCGNLIKPGDIYCSKCQKNIPASMRLAPTIQSVTTTKHNEIIKAKISTKQQEKGSLSQTGPAVVAIVGVICCLLIIGIIIGIPLIAIAIWWSYDRAAKATKLENEIRELELELV